MDWGEGCDRALYIKDQKEGVLPQARGKGALEERGVGLETAGNKWRFKWKG
jgi:hypothetical protein